MVFDFQIQGVGTLASLQFLKPTGHAPASGPLHLGFALPGMLSHQIAANCSEPPSGLCLQWHLPSEVLPDTLFKIPIPPRPAPPVLLTV